MVSVHHVIQHFLACTCAKYSSVRNLLQAWTFAKYSSTMLTSVPVRSEVLLYYLNFCTYEKYDLLYNPKVCTCAKYSFAILASVSVRSTNLSAILTFVPLKSTRLYLSEVQYPSAILKPVPVKSTQQVSYSSHTVPWRSKVLLCYRVPVKSTPQVS
jgi:hypothetical protein